MKEITFGILTVYTIGMITWMSWLNRKKKVKFIVEVEDEKTE